MYKYESEGCVSKCVCVCGRGGVIKKSLQIMELLIAGEK